VKQTIIFELYDMNRQCHTPLLTTLPSGRASSLLQATVQRFLISKASGKCRKPRKWPLKWMCGHRQQNQKRHCISFPN